MPDPDEVRVVVRNQRQRIVVRYGKYESRPYRLMDRESAEAGAKLRMLASEAPPPNDAANALEAVLDKLSLYQCEDCGGLHAE